MRVSARVTETVQGCIWRSPLLVQIRPSHSHSQASSEASASSAGEIVRSATATHRSACVPSRRRRMFVAAARQTGPEELTGLRCRDVDLDALRITVRTAEPDRTNGRRAPGDTKSDAGTCTIYLPAFLEREVRWRISRSPRKNRMVSSSSATGAHPSAGAPSARTGARLGRSLASPTTSGSTISAKPGTPPCRPDPARPCRTRRSAPASRPRRRR